MQKDLNAIKWMINIMKLEESAKENIKLFVKDK